MKFILTFLIFTLLNNCSFNKDSKYWTEDTTTKKKDEKELSIVLEKSTDITKMTIEEYEIYIDEYSKKSNYPEISK
tara:strand:- start:710 stop:937 length:228 start_codon:yes stop_codon:yes gene_type:complete